MWHWWQTIVVEKWHMLWGPATQCACVKSYKKEKRMNRREIRAGVLPDCGIQAWYEKALLVWFLFSFGCSHFLSVFDQAGGHAASIAHGSFPPGFSMFFSSVLSEACRTMLWWWWSVVRTETHSVTRHSYAGHEFPSWTTTDNIHIKHRNAGLGNGISVTLPRLGGWCQIGWFKYFRNCRCPGIFMQKTVK